MASVEVSENFASKMVSVNAEFGDEQDRHAIIEGIRSRVVKAIADKFVEVHGNDILASIDLETIKKKTNDEVAVKALKELIK